MTSVVLVDDQEMVRTGFRMILEARGVEVVGEAADGADGVAVAQRTRPDVVLMDVRMPGMDGIEATARIVGADANTARVLILTTFDLDEYVYRALQAGASGFLLKDARPDALVEAIDVVARGEALLAPSVTRRLIADFARAPRATSPDAATARTLASLTDRESAVLRLVAQGKSNAEIAAELFVGEATVKSHVSGLLSKLGLRDRVQAVVFAYEAGVVTPGATGT